MIKLKHHLFALLLLFLYACNQQQKHEEVVKQRLFPEYDVSLDEIVKSKDGIIRGVDLNDNTDSIIKAEGKAPIEKDTAVLFFEYKLNDDLDYSITYNLQNDSLDEVSVQVNTNDLDLSSKIFNDLKSFYEKKLPNPTEDKGFVVYNCFEGQRKPYVVSLTDNSSPTKGIINLVIYKDK